MKIFLTMIFVDSFEGLVYNEGNDWEKLYKCIDTIANLSHSKTI